MAIQMSVMYGRSLEERFKVTDEPRRTDTLGLCQI